MGVLLLKFVFGFGHGKSGDGYCRSLSRRITETPPANQQRGIAGEPIVGTTRAGSLSDSTRNCFRRDLFAISLDYHVNSNLSIWSWSASAHTMLFLCRSIQRIGDSLKKDTSKGGKTGNEEDGPCFCFHPCFLRAPARCAYLASLCQNNTPCLKSPL